MKGIFDGGKATRWLKNFRGVACCVLLVSAVFALTSLAGRTAQAQSMAAAEALFNDGKRLFNEGRIGEACAKFAESQRIDPSPGTLMNLAACHEKEGKTASAWAEYLVASRAAKSAGRIELAEEAKLRAAGLEGRLATLSVTVSTPVEGLEVFRDGEALAVATWGAALPIDPGRHQLVAQAPGHEKWSQTVVVNHEQAQTVSIPALKKVATPASDPVQPVSAPKKKEPPGPPAPVEPPKTAAYIFGGAGLVVTGVGLAFGAMAKSKYDEAEDLCQSARDCERPAMDARNAAETQATVANVVVPVGVAALVTGVVLYLVQSETEPENAGFSTGAALNPDRAMALIEGRF